MDRVGVNNPEVVDVADRLAALAVSLELPRRERGRDWSLCLCG